MMDFISSGFNDSTNESLSENDLVLSPHVTYLTTLMLLLGTPMVTIPAVFVIHVIMKYEKLQTKNNIFLINLLVSDIILVLTKLAVRGTLITVYLCGADIDASCLFIGLLNAITGFAVKLSFLPVVIDRLLYVAFPFSYKRIVTNKVVTITISAIWLAALSLSLITKVNQTLLYQPSLGECLIIDVQIPGFPIIQLMTVLVIIMTSVYFWYKIYKSNKFFDNLHTTAAQRKKAITIGKLLEKLQKQLKPTISVLIVGGIDGLLNLFVPLIWIGGQFIFTQDPLVRQAYTRMLIFLVQICQSSSHPLTYGVYTKDIREYLCKLKDHYFPKHSKVIVINKRPQQTQ